MTSSRLLHSLGWLLIVAFLLPVPLVSPAETASWKVVWSHPVVSMLQGVVSAGLVALYLVPLAVGLLLLTLAARRVWLASLLALLPWLLFPLAAQTGQGLLLVASRHTVWWLLAALSLLWVGTNTSPNPVRDRLLHYASFAGVILLMAWLFLPGFNRTLPSQPLVRLPFTLVRTGLPEERLLGLGLLLAEVSWLLATLQCVLEWIGIGMFRRRDRRQTLLLSAVFVAAGIVFSELVAMVLKANQAPQAQGWLLVSLALSRLKSYLTLVPLFLLLPVSWDAWVDWRNDEF